MDDYEWMYTGYRSQSDFSTEWGQKTEAFLDRAFGRGANRAHLMKCPCSMCANRKWQKKDNMGIHLQKHGFMPDYTRWIHHGEAHRMREEVVRPRLEHVDDDGGVADMLDDYQQAQIPDGRAEETEASAKAFYDMMSSAQKPLHDRTTVCQLDAIGRVMGFKAEINMGRQHFDGMLALIASMLPEGHVLPKSLYECQKLLDGLKMPYEQIHACPNGCVLFRKEHEHEKYCSKCKSSRYLEVDSGDGHKKQLTVPMKILRYLPFVPRIQRLYMSEESAKQMTWHKQGTRYNPDKMVHPSDGEAWNHFDGIHHEKA